MHSRMFGIIDKESYEKDPDVLVCYDEEVPSFADYTDNDTDLEEDIEWLLGSFNNHGCSPYFEYNPMHHTIKFKEGFKEHYFADRWDDLIKGIMQPGMYERFCSGDVYSLQDLLERKYEFYQFDEYSTYQTMDNFVRELKYEEEYVIFQSIDYHF